MYKNQKINKTIRPVIIDLTVIFGAGNEPATVDEFKKMFPLDYYNYSLGEVIPFAGQNLVTTGKNLYNPTSGKANLVGGQQYQIGGTYTKLYPNAVYESYSYGSQVTAGVSYTNNDNHYRAAKNACIYYNTATYALGEYCTYNNTIYKSNVVISTAEEFDATHWDAIPDVAAMVTEGIFTPLEIIPNANGLFTIAQNTEVVVVGGNDTDTFVSLYNGETNTFEPYEKHTLPLDPSQWRDKQGNLVFPYGGMQGYGTAYDYAKVDADGYIRKAVRVMAVDNILNIINFLKACQGGNPGTNGWGGTNTIGFYVYNNNISSKIMRSNATHKLVGFSIAPWGVYGNDNPYTESFTNDYYAIRIPRADLVPYGYNNSSEDSNIAAFKAYLQDKKLQIIYKLAEPVEVELATPVYAKYLVDKDGTEEITPANGTKPYTTMANLSILYAMDARGEIKNLPKNYISAASMDKFLVKLGVATNGTWSKTYNTQAQDYDFDFVPNPEPEQSNN